jgi:hypothetical protein
VNHPFEHLRDRVARAARALGARADHIPENALHPASLHVGVDWL